MKKLLSILFVLMLGSFCFVYAEENDDVYGEDALGQLLQPLPDEEYGANSLDALQESNEIIVNENEDIAREKEEERQREERIKEKKKQNKSMFCFALGANVPLNLTSDSDKTLNKLSFPLGISLHGVACYTYGTLKGNINWDFVKYAEETSGLFGATISAGFSPIHNDYWFIAFYGTIGLDKIENYSYVSYGASGTVMVNVSNHLGIFINCDATYRATGDYKGDEEIAPYDPLFLKSWRVCPSIGISYIFGRK